MGGKDGEIVCIGREESSGTRDGFESITDTEDACAYRQELTSNGAVLTAVSENLNAIGYTATPRRCSPSRRISARKITLQEGLVNRCHCEERSDVAIFFDLGDSHASVSNGSE